MISQQNQPSIAFDETNLVRNICKQSFFEFVKEFWNEVATEPYIGNWHIKYLCDAAQEEMELIFKRVPKRYDYIIINVPPVTLKSTLFSIFLHDWMWTRAPQFNFIGLSYEEGLMINHALKARDVIKSDKYQACFPEVSIRGDMDAKGTYGNISGGIRYSEGIKGNITGKHGDVVVIDDPLNPKAARSQAETLNAHHAIFEALPNRKRMVSITPTFIVMQRLSQDDPTGAILEMAKEKKLRVKHICLSAEYREWINPPELKKYYEEQEGLLFPARLNRSSLEEFKASGEYFYAGQYDQSPVPSGGGMFKTDKFRMGIDPYDINNPKKWTKQVRYWDKAGTEKGGCFTVGVRMGRDIDGRFWVIHVERFQKEAFGRESRIKQLAQIDGPNVVVGVEQEPGSGGKDSAFATIKNLAGFRVVKDLPTGDKTTRADAYATQVNGENVYLAREGIVKNLLGTWQRVYVEELMFYWFGRYKDQVDSSSGAFKLLTQSTLKLSLGKSKRRK
jgi:predicted phage terminase large subunit-like protein